MLHTVINKMKYTTTAQMMEKFNIMFKKAFKCISGTYFSTIKATMTSPQLT